MCIFLHTLYYFNVSGGDCIKQSNRLNLINLYIMDLSNESKIITKMGDLITEISLCLLLVYVISYQLV